MTVCIAALADSGDGCVLVSDQMTTADFGLGYQFDSEEIAKIVQLSEGAYILVAGDVLFADAVIRSVRQGCTEEHVGNIDKLADLARASYQRIRREYVERTELEPRGLSLQQYYQIQGRLVPGIVRDIDFALRTHDPHVGLIVAGKTDRGCSIYTVQNPGTASCHDAVGFVAIGTGGPHAWYSLIESEYRKSMEHSTVEELVRQAKQRSEVAPGVGPGTTVVVIA